MNGSPGRGYSARLWRLLAGTLAGILILAALLLGALRLAIARVPENAARIQAWVEQQTDYRLEFQGVDARLRWWGPEVVLRDLRVLDRDAGQAGQHLDGARPLGQQVEQLQPLRGRGRLADPGYLLVDLILQRSPGCRHWRSILAITRIVNAPAPGAKAAPVSRPACGG